MKCDRKHMLLYAVTGRAWAGRRMLAPQEGDASYRNYIVDAMYNLTPKELEGGGRYEMR